MKVLLTGGSGFLGKYVQEELKKNDIDYYSFERDKDGDLLEDDDLDNLVAVFKLKKDPFTHLIHLAAKVGGIGANQASPYDFMYDNLQMGLNVIDCAKYYNFEKVVMVGTVCSYPSSPTIPFKEEEMWDGLPEETNSGYGIAKRTLTELLWNANKQYGLNSTTLNLANLYGKNDSQNLETNHVIPAMIKKIKEGKKNHSKVELWGNGYASRDFLFASEAAEAIVKSLTLEQGPRFGINVGTGIETKIWRLAQKICCYLDYSFANLSWNEDKPNGQSRRCLDLTLCKKYFDGWTPQISLENGLKRILNDV